MVQQHQIWWTVLLHTFTAFTCVANGESCLGPAAPRSSCLVQRRLDSEKTDGALKSPFSRQQQQCIEDYVSEVKAILPDYNLTDRHFGGNITAGRARSENPPILGAGFGSTATRSLATFGRQLGLQVHHFMDPLHHTKTWEHLYSLLSGNCTDRGQLDEIDFEELILAGPQLYLDTPMAELFLDFYAASPESKVILTLRPAESWAKSRKMDFAHSAWPLQSPCGRRLANLSLEDSAKFFDLHTTLVRCIVPHENLLEVNAFKSSVDPMQVAKFLGVSTSHYVAFPHVGYKVVPPNDPTYLCEASSSSASRESDSHSPSSSSTL